MSKIENETLNVLNKIRNFKLLKEEEEVKDEVTNIDGVDVRIISDDKLKSIETYREELTNLINNFRETVSKSAKLEPGITIKDEQIRLDGENDNGSFRFSFIAGLESGAYINLEMVELDSENINFINYLEKFNDTFKTIVEPLLVK